MASLKAATGASITRSSGHTLDAAQLDAVFAAAAQGQGAMRQVLTNAGLPTAQATAAAKWVLAAIRLFPVKQQVTRPEVTGNAGTVARFGFCNLPAALIAALIASDGGRLNWLGAAGSTKDFMHFDLREDDQPKLVS
jgi:predicted NBD/HSP70 family sugar kinase